VVSSNKFGYKFVCIQNGHLDYRIECSKKEYSGCLPNGWGTSEEIGRAAVFAKEQIYSQRDGFTGVLSFIQAKITTVNKIDKKKGRILAEGHTPLTRLALHSCPQICHWTRFSITYDIYSTTSFSIDRRKEEPFNENDAHSNENCVLSCNLANGFITWTDATHAAFFIQHAEVSKILLQILRDPIYDYDALMEEQYAEWARKITIRNDKMQEFFEEVIPVVTTDMLRRRCKKQTDSNGIGICRYSGLPLPPVHACRAFLASIEREFVLLPYLEENIIFVNLGMNAKDNSRVEFFENGEKISLNNPELKLRGSRGWNKTLVEEVRKNFASEKGSEASLSVASSWK